MSDETASVDTLSIEELRNQLVAERLHSAKLMAENAELKSRLGKFSNASEAEEEFITNGLLKRMNALQASKEELAMAVEQEEEQMTNALLKRVHGLEGQLSTLTAENAELKSRLGKFSNASEAEEEFITNGLLKRMNALQASKEELAMAVEQEEEQMTNALLKRVHGLEGQLSTLKAEFDDLKEENRKLGGGT